ncbi:4'-phosphopantetheinyl transferase sfp [Kordia antarctica]|uniref:4'-phosphopantetheinyl transferase sfp n=1 Tax=Kordia antarctica TaxID=1218801 RepID=A0A7L4ZHK5_9FLAO|nr:4'-phosphopantetheinyl transferase superfamily protein [Kordia antarctica]QHI36085.1 4'-phosphopantetheinyl transferase sfp [Kordia antarctica]
MLVRNKKFNILSKNLNQAYIEQPTTNNQQPTTSNQQPTAVIDIFFTSIKNPLKENLYEEYLYLLPKDLRERNARFMRWKDRHAHLFGKLLLIEALKKYNIENNIWDLIVYSKHKRPYFTLDEYDFNISHSGDYVLCAIGKNIKLGIDVEENRERNFDDFQNLMTTAQWEEIHSSKTPIKTFYKYWTIKESVIKADGRGFYIPLEELEVENNTVQVDDKRWFINNFALAEGYSTALATNKEVSFKMHELDFYI